MNSLGGLRHVMMSGRHVHRSMYYISSNTQLESTWDTGGNDIMRAVSSANKRQYDHLLPRSVHPLSKGQAGACSPVEGGGGC